jgi:hypothetical protein
MSLIRRDQIKLPVLRRETVHSEALGGEVVLQALTLGVRLALSGKAEDVPIVLAASVRADDGEAVFDVQGWGIWGGSNAAEAMRLFNKVMDLSGMNLEAIAKN